MGTKGEFMTNPTLERLRYHVSGAIERGEGKAIDGCPAFSLDCQGWHIWASSSGKVIVNGPADSNRHLEFTTIEGAADFLAHTGRRSIADEIRGKLAYDADCAARPLYHDGTRRRSWASLGDLERSTWRRNPTVRGHD